MGAGSSSQPPPPRVSKKLGGTTIRLQDLPPVITKTCTEGILTASSLKTYYLMEDENGCNPSAIAAAEERLEALTFTALTACNVRDYTTLLIERTMLRLVLDAGPPVPALLDLARVVNPFLNQPTAGDGLAKNGNLLGEGSATNGGPSTATEGGGLEHLLPAPFRASDLAMLTEKEKDVLVLLYYCDLVNLRTSPDEVVDHVARMAEKYGTIKELDTRKEPLLETEVYIHWTIFYLTTNLASSSATASISLTSQAKQEAEHGLELSRLLTLCEMLSTEDRLDQMCLLLMFLRRLAGRASKGWWRSRAKGLGKMLRKKRPGWKAWHVEYAEKMAKSMKHLDLEVDGRESWERRDSLMLSRDSLEFLEMGKLKGE